jgi:SAM-dependent methyltransferase
VKRRTTGVGHGFSGDPAVASADLIKYLDVCRQIGPIAEAKQWIFERLQVTGGHWVLDVGCGTGDDVAALAAVVGPAGRAVGVDSSEAMIAEASSRHGALHGVSFELADAQQLPFESGQFDACRTERVLQHLPDPDHAVTEMARVLKSGGRVAMMEPDWDGLLIDGRDPILSSAIWRHYRLGVRQPMIGRRLRGLLVQTGFVDVSVEANANVLTDYDVAARQFEFTQAASRAVEAGVVSQQQADRWLDDLHRAAREDRFLCSAVSFRAAGQKP